MVLGLAGPVRRRRPLVRLGAVCSAVALVCALAAGLAARAAGQGPADAGVASDHVAGAIRVSGADEGGTEADVVSEARREARGGPNGDGHAVSVSVVRDGRASAGGDGQDVVSGDGGSRVGVAVTEGSGGPESDVRVTDAGVDGEPGDTASHDRVDLGRAIEAYGSTNAHDGGALVLWEPGYYIAHGWGDIGRAIIGLEVGDRFVVDGSEHVVTGMSEFVDGYPYEDVRDAVGWDAVCLQTCIEGTDRFRVVYCSGAGDFSYYYSISDDEWRSVADYRAGISAGVPDGGGSSRLGGGFGDDCVDGSSCGDDGDVAGRLECGFGDGAVMVEDAGGETMSSAAIGGWDSRDFVASSASA